MTGIQEQIDALVISFSFEWVTEINCELLICRFAKE